VQERAVTGDELYGRLSDSGADARPTSDSVVAISDDATEATGFPHSIEAFDASARHL